MAYLVNQYPQPTQTFIKREIRALEALGWEVHRFTIRRWPGTLVDPEDRRERESTLALLEGRWLSLLGGAMGRLLASPGRGLRASALALRVGWQSDAGLLWHMAYLLEASVLCRHLERRSIRHVHGHFGTNSATVLMLAREISACTYSFAVHGPEEFDKPTGISLGDKIRRAAFVTGISSFARSQMYRWSRREDWSRIHVVRCSAGEGLSRAYGMPRRGSLQLLSVARLAPEKGQLILLQALDQLRRDGFDFRCVIVGDGPLRPLLKARIERARLEGRVELVGWATNAEVRDHLLRSRALVVPSFAEGLPVAIMEAFAAEIPVVATRIAGIPELVAPGQNGWLVSSGSVEDLAEALREVLEASEQNLRELGREGRRRVAAHHDPLREGARLAALLAGALEGSGKTPPRAPHR